MKPSRLIPVLAAVMLVAGWAVLAFSSSRFSRQLSVWLWVAAFGVMFTPLVIWIAHAIVQKVRNRGR